MAAVAKVVPDHRLTSPESLAKAADAAVQEAAKTLRGISGADVISMSAEVEDGKISEYRTTVEHRVRASSASPSSRARGEVAGVEGPQVLDPLADAHELHR